MAAIAASARSSPSDQPVMVQGPIRACAIATSFWGVVRFRVGVVIALQLAFTLLNLDLKWTSFGRLRPVHTHATAGTLPDLAAEAFAEYGVPAFRARLTESCRKFLLVEQHVGLIGFAEMSRSAKEAPGAYLRGAEPVRLYVQPCGQRRGIGRALLRQVEAIAIDTGLSALWFTVWENNAIALAFHAARGFATKGAATYSFRGRQYRNHVMVQALP